MAMPDSGRESHCGHMVNGFEIHDPGVVVQHQATYNGYAPQSEVQDSYTQGEELSFAVLRPGSESCNSDALFSENDCGTGQVQGMCDVSVTTIRQVPIEGEAYQRKGARSPIPTTVKSRYTCNGEAHVDSRLRNVSARQWPEAIEAPAFRLDHLPAEGRDHETNVFEWSMKGDEFVSESSFHTSGKRDKQKNSSKPIAKAEGVQLGTVGELFSFALEDRAEAYRRQVRECFEIGRQNGFNEVWRSDVLRQLQEDWISLGSDSEIGNQVLEHFSEELVFTPTDVSSKQSKVDVVSPTTVSSEGCLSDAVADHLDCHELSGVHVRNAVSYTHLTLPTIYSV